MFKLSMDPNHLPVRYWLNSTTAQFYCPLYTLAWIEDWFKLESGKWTVTH